MDPDCKKSQGEGTASDDHLASAESMESVDVFATAMQNCFAAGKVLIDAILEGTL